MLPIWASRWVLANRAQRTIKDLPALLYQRTGLCSVMENLSGSCFASPIINHAQSGSVCHAAQ
jgi:hypothetical protein